MNLLIMTLTIQTKIWLFTKLTFMDSRMNELSRSSKWMFLFSQGITCSLDVSWLKEKARTPSASTATEFILFRWMSHRVILCRKRKKLCNRHFNRKVCNIRIFANHHNDYYSITEYENDASVRFCGKELLKFIFIHYILSSSFCVCASVEDRHCWIVTLNNLSWTEGQMRELMSRKSVRMSHYTNDWIICEEN